MNTIRHKLRGVLATPCLCVGGTFEVGINYAVRIVISILFITGSQPIAFDPKEMRVIGWLCLVLAASRDSGSPEDPSAVSTDQSANHWTPTLSGTDEDLFEIIRQSQEVGRRSLRALAPPQPVSSRRQGPTHRFRPTDSPH